MAPLPRITRSFVDAELAVAGRIVEGVIVPYEVPAEVADDLGPTPVYREVFTATSFARQLQEMARQPRLVTNVGLKLDHRHDLDHRIGFTVELTSADDGLHGRFELHDGQDLDKIRSMLTRSHTGLSVEAGVRASRVRPDGVVERVGMHLYHVAATPVAAYAGAGITAIRANVDDDGPPVTPLLDAAAAAWGWEIPTPAV